MSPFPMKTSALAIAIGVSLCGPDSKALAQQPTPLLTLFESIPKSPKSSQEADALVHWSATGSGSAGSGAIVALVRLRSGLDAHGAAVAKLVEAANAKISVRTGAPTSADQYVKGAAAAGIDVARMQTDKAYAQQVQAKMKAMSPAELLAMSMAMQQGMGMKGSAAVYDPPAVKAAAEAGRALLEPGHATAASAASRKRWAAVEAKKAAIDARYAPKFLPQPMCDGEGGGGDACKAALARWWAALPQQTSLLLTRDAEVFALEMAAFEEERAAVAADVRAKSQLLVDAQHGAASEEPGNPTYILALDNDTAREIRELALTLERVIGPHAEVAHCKDKYLSRTCWQ